MSATNNSAITCTLCSSILHKPSKYKAFPVCDPCYDSAFELDMTVARKLKWEEPSEILDGLWLGSEGSTLDEEWLKRHNICRILTVAAHMVRMPHHDGIKYLQLDVDDDPSEDLKQHWETAIRFIQKALDENVGVLVHCVSGISRSGATVVAYLMKTRSIPCEEALELVRQRRPCVSPNSGFQRQLLEYQQEIRALSREE